MGSHLFQEDRGRLVGLVVALALLAFLGACANPGQTGAAPDFEVTLFSGGSFRLSDQVDKSALVLNFWYPSCPPCRAEMPDLEKAWQETGSKGVRFLGLFVPQGLDTEQDAAEFVQKLGLTYDFTTDRRAQIAISYRVEYFPTTFFVDKRGQVVKTQVGSLDVQSILRIVREMTGS